MHAYANRPDPAFPFQEKTMAAADLDPISVGLTDLIEPFEFRSSFLNP